MKSKRILNALGQVDERYIDEAAVIKPTSTRYHWVRWSALAACLCLVVGGTIWFANRAARSSAADNVVFPEDNVTIPPDEATPSIPDYHVTFSEDGVTIPPGEVTLSLPDNTEACWAYSFFIYQGRLYKSYDYVRDGSNLIGEHLGYAKGMIDVWTPKDGYVELAGNFKGDFFSVNGYDPEFMLCRRMNNGSVQIFINDNDLTLKDGSDLLEDRFHLSNNLAEVVYENQYSWNYSLDQQFSLNNEQALLDLIAMLDQGTFIPESNIPLPEGLDHLSQSKLYHLFLHMNDGTTIELSLIEGGYVSFGIYFNQVCIQVDEQAFQNLITLFDRGTDSVPAELNQGIYRTMDECRDDPYFGAYIPTYIPENMSFEHATIRYEIEPQTGNILRTEEASLTYRSEEDSVQYYISIADVDDYGDIGWAGTLLTPDELTPEAIDPFVSDSLGINGTIKDRQHITFGVQFGDVIVVLSAYGLAPTESYRIMDSISI